MLSIGPVAKLCGGRPPNAVMRFYAPLDVLADHSETAERFYEWYIYTVWRASL